MDSFKLIQNFFTRMSCQHCQTQFEADDIELIREEHGIHVVGVHCQRCDRQVGVAMVGVDANDHMLADEDDEDSVSALRLRYSDPELTDTELERLAAFDPISADDVLSAHHFFQQLDEHWMHLLPKPSTTPL